MSKKAPSQVVKPPKDLYINEPHFLKRWHAALLKNRWLRGGILALILGLFAAGLVLLALRVWEPPELGKLLPQSTVHYQQTPTQGVAWLANGETPLYFYPQQKRFRQYEVVAENPAHLEVLEQVRRGEIPALSQDPFFQAMRPALPYRADFFEFYRTAEKIEDFFCGSHPHGGARKDDEGGFGFGA